ncbi:MAG: hypothetical protein JW704_06470 [Anaerolineaceae bacterium]|nr:hypothetical protein [Anaerolineaceae bacterium]MBN2678335.1 hypothetical protein [Anaerolineaceae bacterium]
MKTHILRCEQFDDCTSLLDRLKWVKAGRVLLVMPEKDSPVLSRQDLIRLRRKASALHTDLALVSQDVGMKQIAHQSGLRYFISIDDAQNSDWANGREIKSVGHRVEVVERVKSYRKPDERIIPGWLRYLIFSLASLAIAALLAVLLPGAMVDLNLPQVNQIDDLIAPANEDCQKPDLISGIPLYGISIEVEASVTQNATGMIQVGDKPASGLVTFTNLTDQPIEIPAGAVVRSIEPAFRFAVSQPGNLPAGPGTSLQLRVEEMDGNGAIGNLPSGAIVAMDPLLGFSVAVTNPQPLSGGSWKTSPALAETDLQNAREAIDQALRQVFMEQVESKLPDGGELILESLQVAEILSESDPPPYDRPLAFFELNQSVVITADYYLHSDLEQWAVMVLDTSLPGDHEVLPDTLLVKVNAIEQVEDRQALLNINATRQTIPKFDAYHVAQHIRGMSPDIAVELIRSKLVPGSQPEIRLIPAWWLWLPFAPFRISIYG